MLPFGHGHPLSAVTTGFLRNPFPETRAFIQGWRIQPGRGVAGLVSQWACMIISPSPGRPQTSPENRLSSVVRPASPLGKGLSVSFRSLTLRGAHTDRLGGWLAGLLPSLPGFRNFFSLFPPRRLPTIFCLFSLPSEPTFGQSFPPVERIIPRPANTSR